MRISKVAEKIAIGVFIALIIVISLAPLMWVFLSSFKTNREILSGDLGLPTVLSFKNYADALSIAPIIQFYGNSIFVSTLATVGNAYLFSMAAYVIARFQWRGRLQMQMMFSLGLLIPGAALLQPLYQLYSAVGLNDSLIGLVIVYMAFGLPTTVYVLTSYFRTIPRELEESAYLDGAGFFHSFMSIVMPIAKPALGTAAVLEFLLAWNEFQFALTLTSSNTKRTLPIALYYFKSQFASNYGAMFAATIMVVIPSIIVYIALQEQVVSGLSAGAVKG